MRSRDNLVAGCLAACALLVAARGAAADQAAAAPGNMPAHMAAMPLAAPDLPAGTVSVRLVRGDISNNLAGETIELEVDGRSMTEKTDASGRARFSGLAAGSTVKAAAGAGKERIASEAFQVPAAGGTKLLLVLPDPSGATASPHAAMGTAGGMASPHGAAASSSQPPQPGTVVFGPGTRFVFEPGEGEVEVYVLLDIRNGAKAPVNPPADLVITAPAGVGEVHLLDGSSPQASATGNTVTVKRPFAPGMTLVQIAYHVPHSGAEVTLTQSLPAALEHVSVMARQVGGVTLRSPQLASASTETIDGVSYLAGHGPGLAAGAPITVTVAGLPSESRVPHAIALALALAILSGGAFVFWRAAPDEAQRRPALFARREQVFATLVKLEQQRRAERIEAAAFADRRRRAVVELDQVYADLERAGGPVSTAGPVIAPRSA
jgi:hypothetical protein